MNFRARMVKCSRALPGQYPWNGERTFLGGTNPIIKARSRVVLRQYTVLLFEIPVQMSVMGCAIQPGRVWESVRTAPPLCGMIKVQDNTCKHLVYR